jgi:hypothetical protein
MRTPVRPFSIVETSYIGLYPFVRDDRELNDRAVTPLVQSAATAQQLLAAVPWIVPGGASDTEACLQLLRLRDELTPDEWRSALDPRRSSSGFTQLARRLHWRAASRPRRHDIG